MKTEMKKAIEALSTEAIKVNVFGNLVRVNETVFPLPLVKGNGKLGETVYHSSTVPTNEIMAAADNDGNVVSEMGTCPCKCPGCYATKGNYNFRTTKYALIMRTKLLREFPEIYFSLVRIQLTFEHVEKLRIHAAGDFIKGEAKGFYDVLVDFPSVKAWTYTKVKNDPDIDLLDSLPNCNVVKSIIPGCGFNFGHVAYIAATFYRLLAAGKSVYICRCGIDKNQHCSDCDGCSTHEYVLFVEHSTGYNAETDYGFSKLVSLIENQKAIIAAYKARHQH